MQMQELDDIDLLRQYTEQNSEQAFAALVSRHVNKVYSVALRHTRNPNQAEEITQAVFVVFANKSRHLGKGVVLSGWLCKTARLTAMTFIRSEIRRARREQEAHMQNALNETETDVWPQIAPLLDAAMANLSEADYHAVVLRFFDGKSMKEVGAALGASEDAAKMRLNRAVEKLRGFFIKRGVVVPATVLTAAISANSVQAAPAVLAMTATAVAFANGATASVSTLTLIKGALKVMAWTKTKTTIVVSVVVVLAAGTGLQTLALIKKHLNQQQAAKQIVVPGRAWSDAGQGDPKSTFTTFLWAASQSDGKTILNSFTPDGQEHWQRNFDKQMRQESKSLTQIMAQEVPKHFSMVLNQGFTILDQETNAANQMLLHLQVQGDPKPRAFWFKNISGEWKIDNFE
jgi:RNA polymerase sigma factor (sigma-70 family)